MADNLLETLQKLIQDVIAPDVRELKVRLASFESETNQNFANAEKQMDANLKVVLSAIGELKAQSELSTMRMVADLRERVAVLEAQRH